MLKAFAGAALLLWLTGCSRADRHEAAQDLRKAGQEIKADVKNTVRDIKENAPKAKQEIRDAVK